MAISQKSSCRCAYTKLIPTGPIPLDTHHRDTSGILITDRFLLQVSKFSKLAIWTALKGVLARGPTRRHLLCSLKLPVFSNDNRRETNFPIPGDADVSASVVLPTEIWRRILAYTIRLSGSCACDLEDPFAAPYMNEEYPEVDPGIFEDRKSLSLVCSAWRAMVIEIVAEYIVIYSGKELTAILKQFEASKTSGGKGLGDWTRRIDLKILGSYSVQHVVRLLRCTPNLVIYVNKNGLITSPEKRAPPEILHALVKHCGPSLRRIEWSGPGEAPTYTDLLDISQGVSNLETLRLLCIYSYPTRKDGRLPLLIFPKLKTLSLGLIPEPSNTHVDNPTQHQHYPITWDPLFAYLTLNPTQLPSLERLETDIFPIATISFFSMHGEKLRLFRTTTWSAESVLPDALALCPKLQSLVLSHSSDPLAFPPFHPSITRICILPSVEEHVRVPQRVFTFAVLAPLDALLMSVENMVAPGLVELRIRNVGAFVDLVDHSGWLRAWWRRWNLRGVHFRDKTGKSFENIADEDELLLDLVRE